MIEVRPGYFRASWPMAAAAVILDGKDRVLLVQPAYYPGRWLMPGGGAEPADSPRQACQRELGEELGIDLTVGGLLAVDWIPAASQGFAELIYVFDGGRLRQSQIEAIRIPERELTGYQFMTLPDAAARLTPADGRRLTAAYTGARDHRGPVYLEHGHVPAGCPAEPPTAEPLLTLPSARADSPPGRIE
jgi:8-oxo-dGTP pyrophosphatase MutT (NUDIX family)